MSRSAVGRASPRRRALVKCIGLLAGLAASLALATARMPPPGTAPFESARWNGDALEVRLDGTWYAVAALNGIPIPDLVAFAKTVVPRTWREHIPWELARLLELHGSPVEGGVVAVTVVDPEEASRHVVIGAELRVDLYSKSEWAKRRGPWERDLRTESPDLSPAQITEDIRILLERIGDQFSYRALTGYDYESAFAAMLESLDGDIRHRDFARELRSLMAPFGDGHSRVDAPLSYVLPSGAIPCLFQRGDAGRVVAIQPDHSGFLAPEFPYVLSIDGYPLEECMTAVRPLVTRGSPQFEQMQERRLLQFITWWRSVVGAPESQQVRLTLGHVRSSETRDVVLELISSAPPPVMWPRTTSHIMDDNIGYLRLESMRSGDGYRAWLRERMHAFRGTAGLIIDVRGNGGGSRDALQVVAPFLLSPDRPALVANVACYRLAEAIEGDGIDVLENRSLYPAADARWTDAERRAIEQTMASFEPDWELPRDEFSEWHVMTVARDHVEGVYHYHGPVVILLDERCFSATDVFVGALKGVENVTLMGTASSGGSGRSLRVTLPQSSLRVHLSSIASFRRNGARYDGRGVAPDVVLEPEPAYWLVDGDDNVLGQAVRRILAAPESMH